MKFCKFMKPGSLDPKNLIFLNPTIVHSVTASQVAPGGADINFGDGESLTVKLVPEEVVRMLDEALSA